ncbi:glycine betaine/proline transport system ATP-binding protein [Rhizobium azooxidifex]|uniref:Glycine betaine/proline transport system ATP-binding protein n=1 Tax=Mycoplana azooxidifex TaxID=1636188 RepID=A0A7W6DAD7_9HYPH|nr:choline ABC transporter ATP-binding protein [Mycoplana azooxidifex]MBB3978939.1 glycine betaine/proline transport system ATP-binding protein [Mycoplana azooxidifex]
MTEAVVFHNVDIIFGEKPERAIAMVDAGRTRDEIGKETGLVMGVAGASLAIHEGEILVLMGLSGSGKSTLLRAVNGLAPVVRGEVQVQTAGDRLNPYACSPKALREFRMHTVSMVFQQFALLPWRTVADNVGFGLELAGMPEAERKARVEEQLELVNLTQWSGRKVNELSGGMQQRVGLARAFATGAPILLMDEPFSALDPLIRTRLQDELLEFQRRLKKTIIFVSHDLDEAFRIGNRIAIMEGGRIIQCGTPQDIVKNPANQYVADFVQNMNPINMLMARDVMQPGLGGPAVGVTATAKPETPLVDILDAMSRQPGNIGVVENGAIVGMINAQNVVESLTRHRRRE